MIQIIFSVTGKSAFGCVGAASGRKRKKYGADCTAAQRLEIEFRYKFFYEAAKKEFEVFLYAFYMKNSIFPPDDLLPERETKAMTREEMEEALRAEMMAATMEQYTPHKDGFPQTHGQIVIQANQAHVHQNSSSAIN